MGIVTCVSDLGLSLEHPIHGGPVADAVRLPPAPAPDGRRTTVSPHTTPSPQLLDVVSPDLAHWLELPAHRSGVRTARHVMGAQLAKWSLPEGVRDDAVLLISELATNGVCHTPSARLLCGIGLVTDRSLRIEV